MAFIGLFVVIILLCLFLLSLVLLGASIILYFVSGKRQDNKAFVFIRKYSKPSMVIFSFPTVILLMVLAWYGISRITVPENFKDCEEISYIENGFIDESGNEFVKIDYVIYLHELSPSVAYASKPSGLFNRCMWRNIFKYELETGFTIYKEKVDEFIIYTYIDKDELSDFTNYYKSNYFWETANENKYAKDVENILNKYANSNDSIELINGDKSFYIRAISSDLRVVLYNYEFIYKEDDVYLIVDSFYDPEVSYYRQFGYILSTDETETIKNYYNVFN